MLLVLLILVALLLLLFVSAMGVVIESVIVRVGVTGIVSVLVTFPMCRVC